MMRLRSGRGLQPPMPKPDEEMAIEPTPGHYEPLRPSENFSGHFGLENLAIPKVTVAVPLALVYELETQHGSVWIPCGSYQA
ncbi:hypothetical protein RRG08_047780 [Elysia crispata]|uniref:Uncharacterized protein n=1 Tax=Elysia crispata TaxID=231223 RepID=A0AAE0Y3B6_9GAST|nr:hypothetical protein RRG08_047780 [Elysia crispata]